MQGGMMVGVNGMITMSRCHCVLLEALFVCLILAG
jgi:hypothetical protein